MIARVQGGLAAKSGRGQADGVVSVIQEALRASHRPPREGADRHGGAVVENVAVVIPTYKATRTILSVLDRIGPEARFIYVVDDCCPDRTGKLVAANCTDPRVRVIRCSKNLGVGGATMMGYRAAIADGALIIVKIASDGQMDPSLIPFFVAPIMSGEADYTNGIRFFNASSLTEMPRLRILGNAGLSFLTKLSTGYWRIFDPTNGYTAIHGNVAALLPFEQVSSRFFFESDLLYFLSLLRAVVIDVPIMSRYADEESNLKARSVILQFFWAHLVRFVRRVLLNYFLRDFSFGSICILFGPPLLLFGAMFGMVNWLINWHRGVATPTGTIMLCAICVLLGIQFILFFLAADIASVPDRTLHRSLRTRPLQPLQQFVSACAASTEAAVTKTSDQRG